MAEGQNDPYQVVNASQVTVDLKALLAEAAARGIGDKVFFAMKTIVERLHQDPLEFGEPRYDLQWMQLQVRIGGFGGLVVRYAVDEARHLVYLLDVTPLPGLGLS